MATGARSVERENPEPAQMTAEELIRQSTNVLFVLAFVGTAGSAIRERTRVTVDAALLFGAFDGLTTVLPGLFAWIPPELIRMIPFVVTILALLLFSYRTLRERQLRTLGQ